MKVRFFPDSVAFFAQYGDIVLIQSIGIYQEGDFVANFHGCGRDAARNCEEEMKPLMTRWRELRDGERRR